MGESPGDLPEAESEYDQAETPIPVEAGSASGDFVYSEVTESDLRAAASALDEVYSSGDHEWEFLYKIEEGDVLERNGLQRESPLVQELRHLTGYELRYLGVGKAGAELRPRTRDSAAYTWPPAIRGKPADVTALWADLATRVTNERSRARLQDVLFVARSGNGRERALSAAKSYKADYDSSSADSSMAVSSLLRAWELARRMNEFALEGILRAALLATANRELGDLARPGRVLPVLAALSRWPRNSPKTDPRSYEPATEQDVDDALDLALEKLHVGRFATEIVELKKPRLRPEENLDSWRRREVEIYAEDARASEGFAKQALLKDAVRQASRYGLHDLAKQLVAEMQRIPRPELRMARMTAPLEIPMDQVERILSGYTDTADWRDGISYFIFSSPPTGDVDELRRSARETRSTSLLSSLFPAAVLNSARLPTWQVRSDEDAELHAMALPSEIQAQFNGSILVEGLKRLADTYGVPKYEELVDYLSVAGTANVEISEVLARAFLLFWQGEYDAAAHLAVPRIETAARLLLMELDVGVYEIHVGESPSGYPALSSLLEELENIALDQSWAHFLRWLLISPVGPNLRNEIAHGLSRPIGSVYSALILRAGVLLGNLTAAQGQGEEDWQGTNLPPLRPRSREELVAILSDPVPSQVEFPISPTSRRLPVLARLLRLAGRTLFAISRRLGG